MAVMWGQPVGANLFWGDLVVVGGHGITHGDLVLTSLEGWEDLPDSRESWEDRPNQHGSFDAPVWASARRVRAVVAARSRARRDEMYRAMKRTMVFPGGDGGGLLPLTVQFADETLEVGARLTRMKPDINNFAVGLFGFAAEWVAPDPLRYGPEQVAVTGLPTSGGGLVFDLFAGSGVLEFGALPVSGMVTLTNEGTADTHPRFEVVGPLPQGFSLTETVSGSRVEFTGNVPAGTPLTVDSKTGVVMLAGTADRSGQLTRREWVPVPAGGSATFAFAAPSYNAGASLTARVRAAFW